MTPTPRRQRTPRSSLSRERVLEGAIRVADERGAASVSMRKVAEHLGVEAMSLYHHVANKDEILDGIVDLVFAEIDLPRDAADWRSAMRRRAFSARAVLFRHTWALGLMDSRRNPGPATLRHHDWVIGCLRGAGFPIAMAAQAFSTLDSYVYGFVLQESNLPFDTPGELEDVATAMVSAFPADAYPHLSEMITDHALRRDYAYADEFAPGLDLILDGLERTLEGSAGPSEA
ncbi:MULTISPECIES: TetR/AcrR family transcriptional regulator [Nocardiopsis]|uniref:AcrR family transcriptional regulator n=1 Tax=Nocardiopsis sinuspersici TaxID=501010 RepID=A0A1V3BYW7_9ACTN|nr:MULTISPECIES: TetR/AcrR family transcriptional regulator [Nocardiopsis]OOC53446.1 AcrR family transcriptional regulator [Nocardiopsis sinuspersici]